MEQFKATALEPKDGNYVLVAETGIIGLIFPEPTSEEIEAARNDDYFDSEEYK